MVEYLLLEYLQTCIIYLLGNLFKECVSLVLIALLCLQKFLKMKLPCCFNVPLILHRGPLILHCGLSFVHFWGVFTEWIFPYFFSHSVKVVVAEAAFIWFTFSYVCFLCCMQSIPSFFLVPRYASSMHSVWVWKQTALRSEVYRQCRASIHWRCCPRYDGRAAQTLIQKTPRVTIASGCDVRCFPILTHFWLGTLCCCRMSERSVYCTGGKHLERLNASLWTDIFSFSLFRVLVLASRKYLYIGFFSLTLQRFIPVDIQIL